MADKKIRSLGSVLPELQQSVAPEEPRGIPIDRNKESDVMRGALHSLSQKEIDRRIDRLTREVAAAPGFGSKDTETGSHTRSPRWISAADLVDRVRPFLVYN